MLQLTKEDAIVYDQLEQVHIQAILIGAAWGDQKNKTKSIKHRISYHTLEKQVCCCAYCERVLVGLSPQIDHIADKCHHKEFSFESLNLVTACAFCNGSSNKHDKETISVKVREYENCTFKMVHPYIDNVKAHFAFIKDGKVVYDYERCTDKGKYTIDIFGWDSMQYLIMYQDVKDRKGKPIPADLKKLIEEIVTYK